MNAAFIIVLDAGRSLMGAYLYHIASYMQVANVALSLLAKIFATSVIAVKAWCVPSP